VSVRFFKTVAWAALFETTRADAPGFSRPKSQEKRMSIFSADGSRRLAGGE